jgi:outer membrane protein TolC
MVTIGLGVGAVPELIDTVPEGDIQIPALTDAIKTALENRAELFQYDERIAEQARRLAMAEDELRPELNAVASFNSTNNDAGFLSGSLYELGALNMGVELRLPLDKRIIVEDRDVAQRGTEVLKNLRVYQMEQIAEQVRRAYRSVEAARTTMEIFSQNRQIAEDRLQIAQRMVDEGLETNREVLDAQESLTQLENSLLSAKTDLYLAGINLKYAMGEDLSTMVTK